MRTHTTTNDEHEVVSSSDNAAYTNEDDVYINDEVVSTNVNIAVAGVRTCADRTAMMNISVEVNRKIIVSFEFETNFNNLIYNYRYKRTKIDKVETKIIRQL